MPAAEKGTLVVSDASGELMRLPLGAERLVVGRSPPAQVRLDHALVSRKHAEFWCDEDRAYHVRDLGSRNGTLVNGDPVGPGAALRPGDRVSIGPFELSIVDPGSARTMTSTRIVQTGEGQGRISTLKDHASPQIDVAHLHTLNDFSKKLLELHGADDRAQLLCKLMVGPQFRAHWGAIVRTAGAGVDEPAELLFEAHGARSTSDPHLSRGMLRKVRDTGEAVLASNAGLPLAAEMDVQVSISPQVFAMAAIACPVAESGPQVKVLYVILPPALGGAEWLALVNLAVKQYQQAESAWASRRQGEQLAVMERELNRARQIQTRLIPKNTRFEGLDVAIGFTPCHWVGGDYVDALRMADGRTLLAIADVCGKGLSAALVASSVHTMIHSGVLSGLGLPELMSHLNRYLGQTLAPDSFVTMIAIAVDSSNGEIEMVNAGHPPLLVLSPGALPRRIEMEGNMPLGMERDPILCHRLTLGPQEMAAIYSDGLSELSVTDDAMLGIDGLGAELAAVYEPQTPVRDAAEKLSQRLTAIQGSRPSSDDRTFLLARRQ